MKKLLFFALLLLVSGQAAAQRFEFDVPTLQLKYVHPTRPISTSVVLATQQGLEAINARINAVTSGQGLFDAGQTSQINALSATAAGLRSDVGALQTGKVDNGTFNTYTNNQATVNAAKANVTDLTSYIATQTTFDAGQTTRINSVSNAAVGLRTDIVSLSGTVGGQATQISSLSGSALLRNAGGQVVAAQLINTTLTGQTLLGRTTNDGTGATVQIAGGMGFEGERVNTTSWFGLAPATAFLSTNVLDWNTLVRAGFYFIGGADGWRANSNGPTRTNGYGVIQVYSIGNGNGGMQVFTHATGEVWTRINYFGWGSWSCSKPNNYVPTSSTDPTGDLGQVGWDANWTYLKVSTSPHVWKRSALSTF